MNIKNEQEVLDLLYDLLAQKELSKFLNSIEFRRFLLDWDLVTIWKNTEQSLYLVHGNLQSQKDTPETRFKTLLNRKFGDYLRFDQDNFKRILLDFISRLIKTNDHSGSYEDVFLDLYRVGIEEADVEMLRNLEKQKVNKSGDKNMPSEPKQIKPLTQGIDRKRLLDLMASFEVNTALDELRRHAEKEGLENLMQEVILLTSRWNQASRLSSQGILDFKEHERATNPIMKSIIELINKIP